MGNGGMQIAIHAPAIGDVMMFLSRAACRPARVVAPYSIRPAAARNRRWRCHVLGSMATSVIFMPICVPIARRRQQERQPMKELVTIARKSPPD